MPAQTPLTRSITGFSLGLGTAQVLAPGVVSRMAGLDDGALTRLLQRAIGVRELAVGIGVMSSPKRYPWLTARIGGDVMDLALLGVVAWRHPHRRVRVGIASALVAGVTVADVVASIRTARDAGRRSAEGALRATTAVTIRRSPAEVYSAWREFERLPTFMTHLASVEARGDGRSHWAAHSPMGGTIEWDAELVRDEPGHLIEWRSVRGATVRNSGRVVFTRAPRDQGTQMQVTIEYRPPAGALGAAVAKLLGEDPTQQIKDDVRRFKQIMETGRVMRSDGSIGGTRTQAQVLQRPARPVSGAPARPVAGEGARQ